MSVAGEISLGEYASTSSSGRRAAPAERVDKREARADAGPSRSAGGRDMRDDKMRGPTHGHEELCGLGPERMEMRPKTPEFIEPERRAEQHVRLAGSAGHAAPHSQPDRVWRPAPRDPRVPPVRRDPLSDSGRLGEGTQARTSRSTGRDSESAVASVAAPIAPRLPPVPGL